MTGLEAGGENTYERDCEPVAAEGWIEPREGSASGTDCGEHIMARVPPQFQGMLSSVLGTGVSPGEATSAAEGSGGLGSVLGSVTGMLGGSKT
jgi:hypothetical protein